MSENLPVHAPFAGTVIATSHGPDDNVAAGEVLVVLEAMKMEHEIVAQANAVVSHVNVAVGDTVDRGSAARGPRPRRGKRNHEPTEPNRPTREP